jgi:hypothetical protein
MYRYNLYANGSSGVQVYSNIESAGLQPAGIGGMSGRGDENVQNRPVVKRGIA